MAFNREKVAQEAQKLIARGRLDRAIIEYQKLVKANPDDDRTWLKIAELQIRLKAYDTAISTYERVGEYYLTQGFSAKAMAIYKQIHGLIQQHLPESEGHYGSVVNKLAGLYIDSGLKGDAIATYQRYATYLQRVGREKELLSVYRKLVELKEDDLDTRSLLIEQMRKSGLDEEADDQLLEYGDRLVKLGRIDEGLLALDNVAQRRNTDAALARRLADLYLDRNGPGDATLALTRMQACFLTTKRDIETLKVLARAFLTIGQRAKAIEVRKLMVRIAKDNGDLERAGPLVDELLADCPSDQEVRKLFQSIHPDRILPEEPAQLLDDEDVPEVDVVAVNPSFAEDSFELIPESLPGDSQDIQGFPVLDPGVINGVPRQNMAPGGPGPSRVPPPAPPPRPRRVPKVLGSFGPPPERRPIPPSPPLRMAPPTMSRIAPPPPPMPPVPFPPAQTFPTWPTQARTPEPLDENAESEGFETDYDALLGGDMDAFEEPTDPRLQRGLSPLPPPHFLGEERFGDAHDDEQPGSLPPLDFFDGHNPSGDSNQPGSLPPLDFFGDESFDHGFTPDHEQSHSLPSTEGIPSDEAPQEQTHPHSFGGTSEGEDESLLEALEEVDFFVAQGLFDDALASLEELIPQFPGHPLLIEKMQFVRKAQRDS